MPTYKYKCGNPICDEHFEEFKLKIADRAEASCPVCGTDAIQLMTAAHFDYRMGIDSGFPTAYDRWEKIQKQKNRETGGKAGWDSNNNRYGGDHER